MTETELYDTMRTNNLNAWLETEALKLGTDNQRERWAAQLLPEEEMLRLVRAELYKGFEAFARWHTNEVRREMRDAIRHKKVPTVSCHVVPAFEVADVAELEAAEWDTLKKLQALVDGVNQHPWMFRAKAEATIASFTHWATCPTCEAEVYSSGAKISIPWAGRVLVREFRL